MEGVGREGGTRYNVFVRAEAANLLEAGTRLAGKFKKNERCTV